MSMLIEPLGLSTPIAAFNGGVFVRPDMSVIEQRVLPDNVTPAVIELLDAHGVDVWVYRGATGSCGIAQGPHVARETWTVKFGPDTGRQLRPGLGRGGQGRGGERRLRRGPAGGGRGP
jgi:Predicted hydrolases of the HAD superfamily